MFIDTKQCRSFEEEREWKYTYWYNKYVLRSSFSWLQLLVILSAHMLTNTNYDLLPTLAVCVDLLLMRHTFICRSYLACVDTL